jgi:hypothetical protein
VTLVSETQGTRVGRLATNEEGIYIFPNLAGDDYTVEVSLQGCKTVVRRGGRVSGADRVSVPALVLEAGGVSEQVEVKAESAIVQAASGERSSTVQEAQLSSLPIATRGFRDFANLVPGASPHGRRNRAIWAAGPGDRLFRKRSTEDRGFARRLACRCRNCWR